MADGDLADPSVSPETPQRPVVSLTPVAGEPAMPEAAIARTPADPAASDGPVVARTPAEDDAPPADAGGPVVARTPAQTPADAARTGPVVARAPATEPAAPSRPAMARTPAADEGAGEPGSSAGSEPTASAHPPTAPVRPVLARTPAGDPAAAPRPVVARTPANDDDDADEPDVPSGADAAAIARTPAEPAPASRPAPPVDAPASPEATVARTRAGDPPAASASRPVVARVPAADRTPAAAGSAAPPTGDPAGGAASTNIASAATAARTAARTPSAPAERAQTPSQSAARGLLRRKRPATTQGPAAPPAAGELGVARSPLSRLRRGAGGSDASEHAAGDVLARLPAAEPAPAPEPPEVEPASRPVLRVMRSAAPREEAAAGPIDGPSTVGGVAQRLARATAGAIAYEDDGRVGVIFPPPGSVFGSSDAQVAREAAEPDPVPASTAPVDPAPATGAAPAGAAAPLDRDDLYADFMRRFRRDVLEQREQLGDL